MATGRTVGAARSSQSGPLSSVPGGCGRGSSDGDGSHRDDDARQWLRRLPCAASDLDATVDIVARSAALASSRPRRNWLVGGRSARVAVKMVVALLGAAVSGCTAAADVAAIGPSGGGSAGGKQVTPGAAAGAAATVQWVGPSPTAAAAWPPWLLRPPSAPVAIAVGTVGHQAPDTAAVAGYPANGASAWRAGISAGDTPGTPSPTPSRVPYPLSKVHGTHFRVANKVGCRADTRRTGGHVAVPGRPGVYLIPHAVTRLDGLDCESRVLSGSGEAKPPAWVANLTTQADLDGLSESQLRVLHGLSGTLVTRADHVRSEAAAITSGTEDIYSAIVSGSQTTVGILSALSWRDVWVGLERDAPLVCADTGMPKGSIYFMLYTSPPDGLVFNAVGVDVKPANSLMVSVGGEAQRLCAFGRNASVTYEPTPAPAYVPPPEPNLGFRSCFPAAARVTRADGTTARMADVAVGDLLLVSTGGGGGGGGRELPAAAVFSHVYMFAHRLVGGAYDFVELSTSDPARPTLTLSAGHLVYLADGRLVAAAAVVPGDRLQPAAPLNLWPGGDGAYAAAAAAAAADTNGTSSEARCVAARAPPPPEIPPVWVTAVAARQLPGLYNPMTLHGDLIVDGYRVSTYTTALPPAVGVPLSAPLRALYAATGLSTAALEGGPEAWAPTAAATVAAGVAAVAAAAVTWVVRG